MAPFVQIITCRISPKAHYRNRLRSRPRPRMGLMSEKAPQYDGERDRTRLVAAPQARAELTVPTGTSGRGGWGLRRPDVMAPPLDLNQ